MEKLEKMNGKITAETVGEVLQEFQDKVCMVRFLQKEIETKHTWARGATLQTLMLK